MATRSQPIAILGAMLLASLGGCAPDTAPPGADVPLTLLPIESPASGRSGQAALNRGPDGQVVLSWVDHQPDGSAALRSARYANHRWDSPNTVAEGHNWFVNWADFGAVVPLGGDRQLAHWRVRSGEATYAYDVHVALSDNAGQHWQPSFIVHDDGTQTEHGFVSVYPTATGAGLNWLDGRATAGAADHENHGGGGAMQLFNADISARGVRSQRVDARVCDCCQTASALTASGPVVAYRDRSATDVRDVVVRHLDDGRWSEPVVLGRDQWRIEGCPVNGPAMAARQNQVAVAWFTQANDVARVQVAFSNDGGRQFADAVLIDDARPLGRVGLTWLSATDVALIWLCRGATEQTYLCLRRVTRQGAMTPRFTTINLASARRSGFPQITRSGDQLIFAWQATLDGSSDTQVRTGRLAVSALMANEAGSQHVRGGP